MKERTCDKCKDVINTGEDYFKIYKMKYDKKSKYKQAEHKMIMDLCLKCFKEI